MSVVGYGADLDDVDGSYVDVVVYVARCGTVWSGSNDMWYAFDIGMCGSLGGGAGFGFGNSACSSMLLV